MIPPSGDRAAPDGFFEMKVRAVANPGGTASAHTKIGRRKTQKDPARSRSENGKNGTVRQKGTSSCSQILGKMIPRKKSKPSGPDKP